MCPCIGTSYKLYLQCDHFVEVKQKLHCIVLICLLLLVFGVFHRVLPTGCHRVANQQELKQHWEHASCPVLITRCLCFLATCILFIRTDGQYDHLFLMFLGSFHRRKTSLNELRQKLERQSPLNTHNFFFFN